MQKQAVLVCIVCALAALLTALLTGTCLARETFHGAYLQGFPDGSIRPDAAVTRAELAEILCELENALSESTPKT